MPGVGKQMEAHCRVNGCEDWEAKLAEHLKRHSCAKERLLQKAEEKASRCLCHFNTEF